MSVLTVNIEKKLLKENQKLATPKELLVIKEFERVGKIDDSAILSRLGMDRNIQQGDRKKRELNQSKQETLKFDQSRVFHISQIESICNKYYLKFLPADRFRGSIDAELPQKLTTFEVAHGKTLTSFNSYIIAPERSFELEERPKDPLFFFKINSEYFYLIHKWGNDLNIFRRILPLFTNQFFSFFLMLMITATIPVLLGLFAHNLCFMFLALSFGVTTIWLAETGGFLRKNRYDSVYKNSSW